jgi:hypothetical protein
MAGNSFCLDTSHVNSSILNTLYVIAIPSSFFAVNIVPSFACTVTDIVYLAPVFLSVKITSPEPKSIADIMR